MKFVMFLYFICILTIFRQNPPLFDNALAPAVRLHCLPWVFDIVVSLHVNIILALTYLADSLTHHTFHSHQNIADINIKAGFNSMDFCALWKILSQVCFQAY